MPALHSSSSHSQVGQSAFREERIFERLPVGLYICGRDGAILHYNKVAAEVWGRLPAAGDADSRFCGAYRLRALDGTVISHADSPMAMALATGRGCREQYIQIERPDGTLITVLVDIEVVTDEGGQVNHAISVFRDATRRDRGEVGLEIEKRGLEKVLKSLPAAIYMTDAEGRITFYNEAAAKMWGVSPEIGKSEFCGSWKLYWPDGTRLPHAECPMAMSLKSAQPIAGVEAIAERPDGVRIPFLAYPTPLFDESGRLVGAVNMLVDVSQHRKSEVALQRLAAIVESSNDAIIAKDLNGTITSWNPGAEKLFGYTAEEVIGRPITILMPPDRHDEEPEILARIRRGEKIVHYETVRRRKDGSPVDISLSVSPVMTRDGNVVGASKIARDITDKKRAEEQRSLMIREMDHRVKNFFALAKGLVALSAKTADSAGSLVAAIQSRLSALARAHALVLPGARQNSIVATSLHEMIGAIASPYETVGRKRISIVGPNLEVSNASVSSVALIVHEFMTNSVKYGALATTDGGICIECADEPDEFILTWRERGGPPVSREPSHEGFGTVLARETLSRQFGGHFTRDFSPEGLTMRLSLRRSRV